MSSTAFLYDRSHIYMQYISSSGLGDGRITRQVKACRGNHAVVNC